MILTYINQSTKHSPKRIIKVCFSSSNSEELQCSSGLAVVFSSPLFHECPFWPVLDCGCMNSDLYWCKRSCSSCDVVFGSFVTSWMSRQCAFGGIWEGQPIWEASLCAEFFFLSFFHLEIMPLTVVLCGVQEPLK